jgi:replicative DNA helicase
MKLSSPIYHLKRNARRLARAQAIPLHEALDRVASDEGYSGWSLLATKYAALSPARKLYDRLEPGDLVLVGARPGQGKTIMALELAVQAVKSGNPSFFFTLEYTEKEALGRLQTPDFEPEQFVSELTLDCSDAICAAYIMERLEAAGPGTLAVIDYLQLLDQRREHPPLADQVSALKAFAQARGLVIVVISQIDRSFDTSGKPFPDLHDVRLPNPLDLTLFSKSAFLNNGEVRLEEAA